MVTIVRGRCPLRRTDLGPLMRKRVNHRGELGFYQRLVEGFLCLPDPVIDVDGLSTLRSSRRTPWSRLCSRTMSVVLLTITGWPLAHALRRAVKNDDLHHLADVAAARSASTYCSPGASECSRTSCLPDWRVNHRGPVPVPGRIFS